MEVLLPFQIADVTICLKFGDRSPACMEDIPTVTHTGITGRE
jgi:hypothetical protein